jgi:hydroxyethylthiazole kinase-like uncharacterized protein yjeF
MQGTDTPQRIATLVAAARSGAPGLPLHDRAAARHAEAAALARSAPHALMARAGLAVARLALAMAPHARRVQVLAGPGNNGGDGLIAAHHLQLAGRQVQVDLCADPARLPADAAWAWQMAAAVGVSVQVHGQDGRPTVADGPASRPGLIVDALLGLGATRAASGAIAAAIRAANASGLPILAVDLPSGLHPDSGQPLPAGDAAGSGEVIRASATLCLLSLRPGCFTGRGRDLAGSVWLDRLGCDLADSPTTNGLGGPRLRPHRAHATHKGSYGDVAVVGGAAGMVGAAWLAASAALAAGAGRVYVGLLDPAAPGLYPGRPELMSRPGLWRAAPDSLAGQTVVCGCGGGDGVAAALPPLLAHAGRLVLDADALNAIAADPQLLAQLQHRGRRGQASLLTPHPLEAARLLAWPTAQVQADRLAAARALAARCGAVVLLKGSGSVIATPAGQTSINPSGNAALATAGSGDVLAGWIGGHAAAHADLSLEDAAVHCAWLHGAAADTYRDSGHRGPLRAADLVEAMVAEDRR